MNFYNKHIQQEEKADINTPVQSVQVDGIVVLKILQHSKEYLPEMVTGQCMGMTSGTTMEITNCIPLPNQNDDVCVFMFFII